MSSAKPFEPTRHRLQRAKREGDVLRSGDLVATAAFTCGAAASACAFPILAEAAAAALRAAVGGGYSLGPYETLAIASAGIAAASCCGAVAASALPAGGITFNLPRLRWSRLAPAAGFKRMFSLGTAAGALKSGVAAAAIAAAVVPALRDAFGAAVAGSGAAAFAAVAARAMLPVALALCGAGGIFALADLAVARFERRKRLRMSAEEFKADLKQSDGDPHLRMRRRAGYRDLIRGSISRLAEAAFVVVNPTHVAVALEYRPPVVDVPRVLLRAVDDGALEVKRRAAAGAIPIVEDAGLARALLARTVPGSFIPPDLYTPVARIVAALSRAATR